MMGSGGAASAVHDGRAAVTAAVDADPFFAVLVPLVERAVPAAAAPVWEGFVAGYRALYSAMRFGPASPPRADSSLQESGAEETPWFFTYQSFAGAAAPFPLAFMVASAALYLALVYIVAPALRPTSDRARAFIARVRLVHNVALCAFSGLCCGASLWHEIDSGEIFGVSSLLCARSIPGYIVHLNIAFLASKVWEWFDTVLLVWAAPDFRKLSFLHVYHHATTLWLFATVANFPACAKMGMVLNGGVHTLMYAHYARPFPKAVVPLITAAQIGQLAFTVFMWVTTPSVCGGAFGSFASGDNALVYWTPYSFVPVYLCFFLRFFILRYVLRTSHHHQKTQNSSTRGKISVAARPAKRD